MQSSLLLLLLQLLFVHAFPSTSKAAAVVIDNDIIGDPEFNCDESEVNLSFNTKNPFNGRVFVDERPNDPNCSGSSLDSTDRRSGGIVVPFDLCNFRRHKESSWVIVTGVVVVSFHPLFLTKADKSYNVRCSFQSHRMVEKNISANAIEVGKLTTLNTLDGQGFDSVPNCKYEVLLGGMDGGLVKAATIGTAVLHKWSCENNTVDAYCMTVHNCLVDNGTGKKFQMLDKLGCSNDKFILDNLSYQGDLLATKESHVFRYADQPRVFFQCELHLELKSSSNGQCRRPICAEPKERTRRNRPGEVEKVVEEEIEVKDIPQKQQRLLQVASINVAHEMLVFPPDAKALESCIYGRKNASDIHGSMGKYEGRHRGVTVHGTTCLEGHTFWMLIAAIIAFALLSTILGFACMVLVYRKAVSAMVAESRTATLSSSGSSSLSESVSNDDRFVGTVGPEYVSSCSNNNNRNNNYCYMADHSCAAYSVMLERNGIYGGHGEVAEYS